MILEARKAEVYFKKQHTLIHALNGVDFALTPGMITGIAGESGCGKTTLARILSGLTPPGQGSVLLDGKDIFKKENQTLLRRNVQIVFQNPAASFDPHYTIFDSLYEAMNIFRRISRLKAEQVASLLFTHVGLDPELMYRYVHQLSGGQLQRAAIARAVINKPRIIIFDEPTASLDVTTAARVIGLLKNLQKKHGLTFLFISHNLRLLRGLAHNMAVMYSGRIVEYGPCHEVCTRPLHPYTRLLLNAAYQRLQGDTDDGKQSPACAFYGRCSMRNRQCMETVSKYSGLDGHTAECNNIKDI